LIKINLLSVDRERVKRKAKFQIGGQKLTIGCSLILVAGALVVGWWYWSLQRQSADLDQQIADAERERVRLQSVIKQVQEFEARGAQLQQRVSLIEQLRKGQLGPVHLLDHVSRSLPDTMWLTQLRQQGADIVIDGHCTSLNALSDFVSGLEGSNLFVRPVEIVDSRVDPPTAGSPELIQFSVRAKMTAADAKTDAN
jgi:type IV pilus assembly protein PilN